MGFADGNDMPNKFGSTVDGDRIEAFRSAFGVQSCAHHFANGGQGQGQGQRAMAVDAEQTRTETQTGTRHRT